MQNKVPPLIDPSLSLKGETARKCLIFLNQISGWSSSDVGESYGEGFPLDNLQEWVIKIA